MAMNEEFRRAMADGWAKAKEAKAQRRAENRERWASSPANSHNRHKSDAIAPDLEVEAGAEPFDKRSGGGSRALAALRQIMADPTVQLYRRVESAETILSYELGPAALADGGDPDKIGASSYKFLRAAAENALTPEALKFRCLKAIVAVENARASVKNSAGQDFAKAKLALDIVNAEKCRQLRLDGEWSATVKSGTDWAVKPEDIAPATWSWPPTGLAKLLR